ncbi:MAG: PRC-barrel domain-containing protein [Paracoccus sp. (in: a-proteobacteria)]|nr:PRC-barrel domain-containing protein [Paracoccus sp. (in: a-proteobacteria)]
MRKLLLTTAVALPMTFGAAFAQDTAPATDPAMETTETAPMTTDTMADPATDTAETDDVEQAANEWRVDWITGTSVTSPNGDAIGDINDLIVDSETGEMKSAIIGVGGFLGIGEKQIALPWTDLTVNSDAQEITTDLTKEEADAAPEYVFRDQAAPAGDMAGDMTADPATTDTMATEPAAEPMETETMDAAPAAEPMATETDTMETEPMATEPMETETMDSDMDSDMDGDMKEETAPAN